MADFDYEKLLDSAQDKIPEKIKSGERFEIPKVTGHFQGNKTIISNFSEIASTLGREPSHIIKYLTKALATSIELQGNLLVLGRKIKSAMINDRIEHYAKLYVMCKECGKPDTELIREDRLLFIKCQACGARHAIPEKI